MPADEFYLNDFWDTKEALVVQHTNNVFPALLAIVLISPEILGLLVFDLQLV